MASLSGDTFITVVLAGVGIYFSVLVGRSLAVYLLFLRLRPTALLSWPAGPPSSFGLLLGLGVLAAVVAVLNGFARRPPHHVYSQGITAFYFLVVVPLLARIQLGLYGDGVWAERGFLPYAEIGRMTFRESPEIVLLLVPKSGRGSFRLRVPPAEYGAVRKVLEEKVRDGVLTVEAGLLGLAEPPAHGSGAARGEPL